MVQVNPMLPAAVAVGIALGLGLWVLVSRAPRLARPDLAARIAPHLLDVSAEARRISAPSSADPLPVLGVLAEPALRAFQNLFGSVLGVAGRTAVRLRQAGDARSVEAYRVQQMLWTAGGAVVGLVIGVLAGVARGSAAPAIAGPVVGAALALWSRDRLLLHAGRARTARLESELPTVLEFFAMSLAAGEGVHDAIRRIGRGSGELSGEFRRVVAEVAVGVPLSGALARMGDELRMPSVTRCLAHVVGALDRGAPLADLLRAQAGDAREEARRRMLESAGKKEIAMLVPLVFLILPITILFAVFPGIMVLQTSL